MKNIEDHHNRRMVKIKQMIAERRRLIQDHHDYEEGGGNGRRLSDEELSRTERQITNFERKLQQMRETNTRVSFCLLLFLTRCRNQSAIIS